MKKYSVSIRIAAEASSPQEAAEIALRAKSSPSVAVGAAVVRELKNPHNEEMRIGFFHAIDDLSLFQKVVRAVALGGVVFNEKELDSLVSSGDDGDGEDLLSAYNEGFQKGCDLTGKPASDVLDEMCSETTENEKQEDSTPHMFCAGVDDPLTSNMAVLDKLCDLWLNVQNAADNDEPLDHDELMEDINRVADYLQTAWGIKFWESKKEEKK